MKVKIEQQSDVKQSLPERLSAVTRYRLSDAVNRENPRTFTFTLQQQPPYWTFNGRSFDMEGVAAEETVKLNTLEVWEFVNQAGTAEGEMMETAHPIHLHAVQFQIIERSVRPDMVSTWESVSAGFVDEGWKDSMLVMPGERVKILVKFENYAGLYLYHCHNLEHEDLGMMRNYRITA